MTAKDDAYLQLLRDVREFIVPGSKIDARIVAALSGADQPHAIDPTEIGPIAVAASLLGSASAPTSQPAAVLHPRAAIAKHVREIQSLCESAGYDPLQWLAPLDGPAIHRSAAHQPSAAPGPSPTEKRCTCAIWPWTLCNVHNPVSTADPTAGQPRIAGPVFGVD